MLEVLTNEEDLPVVFPNRGYEAVFLEHVEVVTDCAIVDFEEVAELVGVEGFLFDGLDYPPPVDTSPGPLY